MLVVLLSPVFDRDIPVAMVPSRSQDLARLKVLVKRQGDTGPCSLIELLEV